jgi:hypothetical protein
MTAPDNDVRPARRSGAESSRGAGAVVLARLLLHPIRRVFLLFAVASLTSACIIPVAPEFQDPPGAANSPPEILNPDPLWGEEVAATPTVLRTFSFTFSDVNADDTLWVRWTVDGISGTQNPTPSGSGGTPAQHVASNTIACVNVDQTLARHTVIAGVADKPFSDTSTFKVDDNGKFNFIPWTLNMTCP